VDSINTTQSRQGRGTLRAVTLRGEPTWAGVAAATSDPAPERATGPTSVPARVEIDGEVGDDLSVPDLEHQVYEARELHGAERADVRRLLADGRRGMSDATYRRALVLARDSVLLSIEECLSGARAMEWEPAPRPEFSLETIEAAVAEQERQGDDV
jgi:hypothetical protein